MRFTQVRPTAFLVVFLGTILLLLAGCSGKSKVESTSDWLAQMKKSVSDTVKDPHRTHQITHELEQVEIKMDAWNTYLVEHKSELRKLNANYDSTPEDFRAFIDSYNSKRHSLKKQLLAARFKIKELSTEDEWDDIAELEKSLFLQWWTDSSNLTHLTTAPNGEVSG